MSTFGAITLVVIATSLTLATLAFIMWVIELEAPMKAPPLVEEVKAWVPHKLCPDCGDFASQHVGYPGRRATTNGCCAVRIHEGGDISICECPLPAEDV